MKFVLSSIGITIALAFFVGVISAKEEEDLMRINALCMERNDISEKEMAQFQDDDFDPSQLDDKFKCFFQCLMGEMGYFDDFGKLDMAKLEGNDRITQEHKDIAAKCKAEHDAIQDPCEYSFMIATCAWDLMKEK
ncbi:general odorant-binding protein 57c-like [Haematobia irritans]|uniref:general odorant-binding protein 57c-like n=1 Tax=Haematobia irritans TaxID=7368 RepID=UPI003F50088D